MQAPSTEVPADADHDFRREYSAAVAFLERVKASRALLVNISDAERVHLFELCGAVVFPADDAKKELTRAFRKQAKAQKRRHDTQALQATGLRQSQMRGNTQGFFERPPTHLLQSEPAPLLIEAAPAEDEPTLHRARSCYCCQARFSTVHHFYASMCSACGDFNWEKRVQTADLRGRHAVVTGARVKIGFHIGLKLLRAGASVVVVTRFPRDAEDRYAREPDYAEFSSRLRCVGVDLRSTVHVEQLCDMLVATLPKLDYLVHNSCQTVRRPPAFYKHLLDRERSGVAPDALVVPADGAVAIHAIPSFDLTQLELLKGDEQDFEQMGVTDVDGQQVDSRSVNSWKLGLGEVSTVEAAEVFLVNALAPFIMNSRLKELMMRCPQRDAVLVNVSAMEGQFYRTFKTSAHPHTNMAKAALNMMTRTSAQDYAKSGIYMNSVDTGWVTDENPKPTADRLSEQGFAPPLDVVDGAARCVAPIFDGVRTGEYRFGLFLKNYKPAPW